MGLLMPFRAPLSTGKVGEGGMASTGKNDDWIEEEAKGGGGGEGRRRRRREEEEEKAYLGRGGDSLDDFFPYKSRRGKALWPFALIEAILLQYYTVGRYRFHRNLSFPSSSSFSSPSIIIHSIILLPRRRSRRSLSLLATGQRWPE